MPVPVPVPVLVAMPMPSCRNEDDDDRKWCLFSKRRHFNVDLLLQCDSRHFKRHCQATVYLLLLHRVGFKSGGPILMVGVHMGSKDILSAGGDSDVAYCRIIPSSLLAVVVMMSHDEVKNCLGSDYTAQ